MRGKEQPERRASRLPAAALVLAFAVAGAPAWAQSAPPAARPVAPAAPALETARVEFEKLPDAERKAIQDALVWTGGHTGVTTGGFGPRTFQAISAYQRRAKLTPDGVLDAKERAALQAAAQRARDAVKFAVVGDQATGARIGVPERVLSKRGTNPNGGGRWQSADEKITLDTRALPTGETDLAALYERNLAIQTPGRQVTYSVLRPEFFVITGETPTGKFYMRYAAGPSGLRGFSLGYDKALAKEFDRTVIAIANSFEPFPSAVAAAPAAVAPSPAPPPPARPAAIEPPRPAGPIATGLTVAQRRIVTTAAVEACPTLRVGRAPARIMRADKAVGLALLELETERAVSAAPLRSDPAPGLAVVALAFQQAGASSALVVTPGETATGTTLLAPLQPGAAGAPVFDRTGGLVGLVGPMPTAPRLVAGIVPPGRYPLVPAAGLASFLEGAVLTMDAGAGGSERSAGEIASAAGPSVVAIECVR